MLTTFFMQLVTEQINVGSSNTQMEEPHGLHSHRHAQCLKSVFALLWHRSDLFKWVTKLAEFRFSDQTGFADLDGSHSWLQVTCGLQVNLNVNSSFPQISCIRTVICLCMIYLHHHQQKKKKPTMVANVCMRWQTVSSAVSLPCCRFAVLQEFGWFVLP